MTRGLALLWPMLAAAVLQGPPPKFGTTSDAVVVDAAVFDGDRVVMNLGIDDFEVRDNGVIQDIQTADFNALPIHLRLLFDTSGSISEDDLERYVRTMRRVASTLGPRDLYEVVTFNVRIFDAVSRQSPPVTIDFKRIGEDGTAFFDAVSLAMVNIPAADRRQITIILSDARDNASFFDEAAMLDAAGRTDAVVYTVLPGNPLVARALPVLRLQALSLLTGGRLVRTHEDSVGSAVIAAIEEFRQSYVLRYYPTGVAIDGWHKIDLKVRRGRYRIRSRLGYFGG